MSKRTAVFLLILLAAAALRLILLADVPPGMTHDEADHGLDAWGVVNGIRPIYFSVGYGREPLYDYATALLMASWGPTYFAGRLTAVFFSLILVAATAAWTRLAFNWRIAALSAAGLTVSFWAVMTARHALRSVTMPALFTLAAWFYWRALRRRQQGHTAWPDFIVSGVLLGITFYTYMPARILWAIFPAMLVAWLLFDRALLRRMWSGTLAALAVMAAVAAPLLLFLATTETEQRLDQLSGPLTAAAQGDFAPLWRNAVAALRLFTVEGDTLWRYNLPGRPFLTPVMGVLFYAGIVIALWWVFGRKRSALRSGAAFALLWLVAGFAPALITGPEASVTRAIAMQPVLYLFPAIALATMWTWLEKRVPQLTLERRWIVPGVLTVLFSALAVNTATAYFDTWARAPEVRVQYEATRVAAMRFLNANGSGAAAVSSPTPDRFHDPSTGLMTLRNDAVDVRWFNGSGSLIVPDSGSGMWFFSGFAPLHPALEPYFAAAQPVGEVELAADDLDRPLVVYSAETAPLLNTITNRLTPISAQIGTAHNASLHGYDLLTPVVAPGGVVELVTLWQASQPIDDVVLFTHLLGPDGVPLAQADRLDAPSAFWYPGDHFLQLHTFQLPSDIVAGVYPLAVGAYQRLGPDTFQRLQTSGDAAADGDLIPLTMVQVQPDA